MNHHEMTAQEAADWCAKDDGWTLEHLSTDCPVTAWWRWNDHPTLKSRTWSKSHPYPLTLDSAARAMPEVWDTWRTPGTAVCGHCAHQLSGSFPPIGSRCACAAVRVKIEWYRDHPATGRSRMWGATAGDNLIAFTADTGDEIADRYRLAVLCRIAALIPTEGDRRKMLMAALEELGPRPVKEASDGNQVR